MTRKWLVAMLGAVALAMSASAIAQKGKGSAQKGSAAQGFYAGAELGQADFGSDEDTALKILGGFQFHPNVAAEAAYGLLFDKSGAEVTSLELVAVGMFPVAPQLSVLGKLGFANVEVDTAAGSRDDTEITYGIGAQYDFSRNLGGRVQWQRYDTDPQEIDLISIGVIWRF